MTVAVQDPTANPADLVDLNQQKKLAEGVLNQLGLHPNQAGARNLLDMHFQGPTADGDVSNTIAPLINTNQPATNPEPATAAIAPTSVPKAEPVANQPTAPEVAPKAPAQESSPSLISMGGPTIPSPSAANRISSGLEDRTLQDQNELNRLVRTGAGISQIKNPFLKGLAATGDIAGAALFPSVERLIPGTYGHHGMLVDTQMGTIKNDLENLSREAQTEQARQETENQANEPINKPNELATWMKQNPDKPIAEFWKQKSAAMLNKLNPQELAVRWYMTPVEEGGMGMNAAEALKQVTKDLSASKPPTAAAQEGRFQALLARAVGTHPDPKILSDANTLMSMIATSPELNDDEKKEVFAHLTSKTSPAAQGTNARIRGESLLQRGLTPVIDRDTGMLTLINAQEHIQNPNRYISAAQGGTSMTKEAIYSDMHFNSGLVRQSIKDLKTPFTTGQRGQLALALSAADPKSAWDAFWHSSIANTLSPDQVDYVTALASIQENAMALRSIQGLGQGSDELRAAIRKMVPSGETPNPEYANRQLDIFDAILNRLETGVPKSGVKKPDFPEVPKTAAPGQNPESSVNKQTPPDSLLKTTPEGHYVTSPDGSSTWQKVKGKWVEYKEAR